MVSDERIVFSRSLKEVQWGNYGNISLVADDAIAYIKSLKLTGGKVFSAGTVLHSYEPVVHHGGRSE